MGRFVVNFYPGEVGERMPEWQVVEYTNVSGNVKTGSVVWRTYDMVEGEYEASQMAAIMQESYNREFYAEFG